VTIIHGWSPGPKNSTAAQAERIDTLKDLRAGVRDLAAESGDEGMKTERSRPDPRPKNEKKKE